MPELAHEAAEVSEMTKKLRRLYKEREVHVRARPCEINAKLQEGEKLAYFVRHGEGIHNVAQQEWRREKKPGEPYTLDTDPEFRYLDAQLTSLGREQASALATQAANIEADLYLTSPLRRATQTLGLGFSPSEALCLEDLHEQGGLHTCDRRKDTKELKKEFPWVDYSLIKDGSDPLWGEGIHREEIKNVQARCQNFLVWLQGRAEKRIVIATHSAFLNTLFNAVLECDDDPFLRTWFSTGEMRPVILTF